MKRKYDKYSSIVSYGRQIVVGFKTVAEGDAVVVMMQDAGNDPSKAMEMFAWHLSFHPEEKEALENIKLIQAGLPVRLEPHLQKRQKVIEKNILRLPDKTGSPYI